MPTKELDLVVLTHNNKKHGLKAGDIGTVVHIYEKGKAFETEFVTAKGKTIAVLTLTCKEIRSIGSEEIFHVRELSRLAA